MAAESVNPDNPASVTRWMILLSFLKLGCVAFGGPVAHLGYFQEEFVQRRRWIDANRYADLVALCQFLPGPTSSQIGFAIGHYRGGISGGFLAWLGFTLPSALLMLGFAMGLATLGNLSAAAWIIGLKLAAVAVVANAIWSMASTLCPDRSRALMAIASAAILLLLANPIWQPVIILAGAVSGAGLYRQTATTPPPQATPTQRRQSGGWLYLAAFALLLVGLPMLGQLYPHSILAISASFYQAGSLVFGGGHVILPLLDAFTVEQGWVDADTFLAGYGAAQALPGPLFTFAAFLGSSLAIGPGDLSGGLLALVAVFLPSWLLVLGALPYWEKLRQYKIAQAALMGTNAAVVGLLLAAFYQPIWTESILSPLHLAFALLAFALLRFGRIPPWLLVLGSAAVGHWVFAA